MTRRLQILLVTVVASGCYTFQPTSVDQLSAGQEVRTRVTGAYSDSLRSVLLTDDARVFDGEIVEGSGRSVLMEVVVESQLQGMRMQSLRQRVQVPRTEIVDIEVKELDRKRTFLTFGAVGVAVGSFVVAQLTKDTGGSNRPGGGGPVESVVSPSLLNLPLTGLSWLLGR